MIEMDTLYYGSKVQIVSVFQGIDDDTRKNKRSYGQALPLMFRLYGHGHDWSLDTICLFRRFRSHLCDYFITLLRKSDEVPSIRSFSRSEFTSWNGT